MKKIYCCLFAIPLFLNAQINTSTGGAGNINANVPSSNTNVGIGTNNPTNRLQVIGDIGATQGIFTGNQLNGSNYSSYGDQNDKCVVFAAGSVLGTGPGYNKTRMVNIFDFPIGTYNTKPMIWFNIVDRSDMDRFRMFAQAGGETSFNMFNKSQQECFRVYEDGTDNVYMHLPKSNSRIVVGADGYYLPEHKFVVRGSSMIEGNILTDSNVGIGTSSFVDGTNTYRLSVKGKVRAEEIKVYNTWADYVFNDDYKLPTLQEVENHINEKGYLINMPSATEIQQNGLMLGEITKLQQEKIEELTLYLIQQSKEIEELKIQVKLLLEKSK